MENGVDTNQYSRQISTFGMEAMGKLIKLKILIVGMRGLGVETAKNIILCGPQSVDIFDPSIVTINDLGSNFYLTEEDIGKKKRDEACLSKLSDLNTYVKISLFRVEPKNDLVEYFNEFCEKIKVFDVVTITELQPMNFINMIDETCRVNKIKFIYGVCFGLAGYVFTDFGPEHIIFDINGQEKGTYLIKSITNDEEGLVTIDNIDGTNNLKIGDGDYVKFKDVEGMIELNEEGKNFEIQSEDYQSFRIGDTSKFGKYIKGGIAQQVKIPEKYSFFDFKTRYSCISDPAHPFQVFDSSKKGRQELLYIAFYCINNFYICHNFTLPELNNMEHAKEVLDNTKNLYDMIKKSNNPFYVNIQEFDEKIVLNTIRWSRAEIAPVTAFFGGIISHEIIKSIGKYLPIDQWLIMDFFHTVENLKEDIDRTLKGTRYDDQIAIYGNEIQKQIEESNLFLAGTGATGCEFIKNFAMMGFCTNEKSKLTITDNDNIEISNLSRQFLFRKKNVGQSKSVTASNAIKSMNPKINIQAMQTKICEETEDIFNDDFWNKQSLIIFAVDSVEARKYIDKKVVKYEKCAIDSGTLGTRGNSQLIIPKKTRCYNDTAPIIKVKEVPMCTLRHFPSLIEHCIEWSRTLFYDLFTDIITCVSDFFTDFNKFKTHLFKEGSAISQLEKIQEIKILIDITISRSFDKIVEYSISHYTKNFDHDILQLLKNYPPDCKIFDNTPFWTGSKKLPHNTPFNPEDELCLLFVKKYVFILSNALGISFPNEYFSDENIKNICKKIKIPEYIPKKNDSLDDSSSVEGEKKQLVSTELAEANLKINKILEELEKIDRNKVKLSEIVQEEFEKDHDENGHIDFIHACSNLRARNYCIDECDRNKTKVIAGKIIATIMTTTAVISGAASIELYTLFQTHDIKYLRNCSFDLSSNFYLFSKPLPPIEQKDKEYDNVILGPLKVIPEGWNIWDKIEIKGSKTCEELIKHFKDTYNVNVYSFAAKEKEVEKVIFTLFDIKAATKKPKKIEDLYNEIADEKLKENKNYLYLSVFGRLDSAKIGDKEFKFVSTHMPTIKYIFK